MSNTYAVIIAIENYQFGIKPVIHALADAKDFRDVLVKHFQIQQDNIKIWLDSDVTQNRLLEELPFEVGQLGPEDRFFFFYAGHGFFAKGTNRLATWDSHPNNLEGTTVDLEAVLFKPLRASKCQRTLVFIDACAKGLDEADSRSRDAIADMRLADFEELVKTSKYSAAFFSCSPGQKSFSSEILKHGIWTHHLLTALRGDAAGAIQRDNWITGESLKVYLRNEVPKYIRDHTDIRGTQIPCAQISVDGLVEIRQVESASAKIQSGARISPLFAKTTFRSVQTVLFKSMDDFSKKRGNTEPDRCTDSADSWAKRLTKNSLDQELDRLKGRVRTTLQLGRSAVTAKFADEGGGTIDTDLFRYKVYAGQDQDDPRYIEIVRELILRVPYDSLPATFESIFDRPVNEMVVPITMDGLDYDEMANMLDEFATSVGAAFEEEQSSELATLSFPDGKLEMVFDYQNGELRITAPGVQGSTRLIEALVASQPSSLIGSPPKLLGAPRRNLTRGW